MIGRVVSTKTKNTATVLVERTAMHPLYKKTYVQSKKYLVDDSIGVKVGDIVDFVNCKPISKRKSWTVTKVLGKNFAEIAEAQLKKEAEKVISEVMPEEGSENSENSEGQVISRLEDQKSDSSDKTGTPSRSESSENKEFKTKRRSKK